MKRFQELKEKVANASLEDMLFNVSRWNEELSKYEEGNAYFNSLRAAQQASLEDFRKSNSEILKGYMES